MFLGNFEKFSRNLHRRFSSIIHCCTIPSSDYLNNSEIEVIFNNLRMITDIQLGVFANLLGVGLFMLIIAFHWVSVMAEQENPKKKTE